MNRAARDVLPEANVITEFKLFKKTQETAIVAGAAGFVGSRICDVLVEAGLKVIGLDNYISGKEYYLERLIGKENFEIIELDLQKGIPQTLVEIKPQYIVDALDVFPHIGRPEFGLNELLNNSIGLKNLLEFVNITKAKFVFTSSVDIYQGLASHEYLQNYYDGKDLTTYYAFLEGKRYGEALCREYLDNFGIDIRIVRIPEIYGPRMDLNSSSILSQAVRTALEKKDLVFHEEGSQQHQLLYIDDFAYGLLKLLFSDNKKIPGGIFYFANPEFVSTLSIAYTLRAIIGGDVKVEFVPQHLKVGYPPPQKIDISRSMKLLRWAPQTDLTEGLEKTMNWFVEQAKHPEAERVKIGEKVKKISEEEYDRFVKEQEPLVPIMPVVTEEVQLPKSKTETTAEIWKKMIEEQKQQQEGVVPDKGVLTQGRKSPLSSLASSLLSPAEKQVSPVSGRIDESLVADQKEKKTKKEKHKPGWLGLKLKDATASFPRFDIETGTMRKPVRTILLDVILGVVLISVLLFIPLVMSLGFLWRGEIQLRENDYMKAEQLFEQSVELFRLYQAPAKWVGLSDKYEVYAELMQTGIYGARLISDLNDFADSMRPITDALQRSLLDAVGVSYTTEQLVEYINRGIVNVRSAQTWYTLMKQSINQTDPAQIPASIRSQIDEIQELIWLSDETVANMDVFLEQIGQVLGFGGPKRYVVWLQNNNELRPTGGFIGSYIAFDVSSGRILNIKVDDIYNPDGLLEAHDSYGLDPVMVKYFGASFLPIRDTNWWPSFPKSAQAFVDLYQRATKELIDGVIAINLSVVEDILAATGGVVVADYDEVITEENLGEKAQTYAEVGFTPGSEQKAAFLTSLTESLIKNVGKLNPEKNRAILLELFKDVVSRNIMFYTKDVGVEETLTKMNLAGVQIPYASDYLKVVDTNIGGNKINYWMKRLTNYEVDVDREGNLGVRINIKWRNKAESNTWPAGEYVNYLRVIVPNGVTGVTVSPKLEDYNVQAEGEHKIISGVMKVPIQSEKEVNISYQLPSDTNILVNNEYNLVWETQPGMKTEEVSFKINLPTFLSSEAETEFSRVLEWPVSIKIPVSRI